MNLRPPYLAYAVFAWAALVGVSEVFGATSNDADARQLRNVKENQEVHIAPADFCTRNQTLELMIANPVVPNSRSLTPATITREGDSVTVILQDNSDVWNTRDAVQKLNMFIIESLNRDCLTLQTWKVKGITLRGLHIIKRPDGQPDFDFRKD
ncbi:hypothetical protein [Rhizobium leguminosarum]|uniref:hypothetical protein n=1 Tax=Rhizobium leguminosarum TaxID=384 RepID=UPI0014425B7F|nr:hypothetical protein [Rhizobium leguminosarum]NKL81061.1 hypothetical protein [Rhizobium leguminosarum bv. viciae]